MEEVSELVEVFGELLGVVEFAAVSYGSVGFEGELEGFRGFLVPVFESFFGWVTVEGVVCFQRVEVHGVVL
jgi:hypothetical protein